MEQRSSSFGKKLAKAVVIALVFGLVAGGVFAGVNVLVNRIAPTKSNAYGGTVIEGTGVSTATTMTEVSDIASSVLPSVVSVTNISLTQYRTLFGTSIQETPSAGTGVIFNQDDSKLYIVTNNHVIENSNSLTVTFCDESAVDASVVGTSVADDVAVISVKLSDISDDTKSAIKTCVIGDSNELRVGDGAIIIGNALGYGQSVTTGVISALGRKVEATDGSGRTITNTVIQTDAAVNPGNSGGPLLNMKGEMVGIVSAKLSSTSVEGMGYAIPSSTVSAIIYEIMDGKDSARDTSESDKTSGAYLGIAGMDVTQSIARQYNMSIGVYVTKVYTGSAAEAAGLSQGDVIVAVDGTKITGMSDIKSILADHASGDKVKVTVERKGKKSDLEVTLGSSV